MTNTCRNPWPLHPHSNDNCLLKFCTKVCRSWVIQVICVEAKVLFGCQEPKVFVDNPYFYVGYGNVDRVLPIKITEFTILSCTMESQWDFKLPHIVKIYDKNFKSRNKQNLWRDCSWAVHWFLGWRKTCLIIHSSTSNRSWCMGIKGEISGTVCVTFTWDMYIYIYIYELFIAFVSFVVCSLL